MNNENEQPIDKMAMGYELLNLFCDNNYEAYIVGGASRDILMGTPGTEINDIDITTNASPEQIIELANANNIKWFQEGNNSKNYGTVTLLYNNIPMQVTPFRRDENYDGRHCECKIVKTLKEDLGRRDITINAIALDKDGYPIDYFCGIADMARRRIKTIEEPQITYKRDELRAMRVIRIATEKDFKIEEKTYNALKNVKLDKLSDERIRDELIKILKSLNRHRGITMLDDTGLLKQIIPEIETLKGTDQDETHHPEKDTFIHTMLALKSLPPNASVELSLAALLHDIGKPITRTIDNDTIHFYEHENIGAEMAEDILYRLTFKVETIKKVTWLIKNHMRIHKFSEMKKSKKVQLITHPYFNDLLELLKADIIGSSGINKRIEDLSEVKEIIEFMYDYNKELEERPVLKQKLIDGYDIMNLGLTKKDGIVIGHILERINEEVIEGRINTKEEACQYAKKLVDEYLQYSGNFKEQIQKALNHLVEKGLAKETIKEDGEIGYSLTEKSE